MATTFLVWVKFNCQKSLSSLHSTANYLFILSISYLLTVINCHCDPCKIYAAIFEVIGLSVNHFSDPETLWEINRLFRFERVLHDFRTYEDRLKVMMKSNFRQIHPQMTYQCFLNDQIVAQ